jgi:hypothetical protein
MRVPQVSERIKEAPAQALRGVFAGIGQLLLITDKLRNKATASQQVPQARTPEPSETVPPAAPAPAADASAETAAAATAAAATAASAGAAPAPGGEAPGGEAPGGEAPGAPAERDFDKTGNVRLLTRAEAAAGDTAPVTDATVAKAPVAAEPVAAEPVAAGAPLPNYDELSIASLRARLRNLDVAQLRQLVEYESAHANRTDVITMFERRVAKLQAGTTPEERGEAGAEAEIEAREEVEAEVQQEVGAEAEGEE